MLVEMKNYIFILLLDTWKMSNMLSYNNDSLHEMYVVIGVATH